MDVIGRTAEHTRGCDGELARRVAIAVPADVARARTRDAHTAPTRD